MSGNGRHTAQAATAADGPTSAADPPSAAAPEGIDRLRAPPGRRLPAVHIAIARQVVRVAFEAVAREAGLHRAAPATVDVGTAPPAQQPWVVTDEVDRRGPRTLVVVSDVAAPVAQGLVDGFCAGTLAGVLLADEPWALPAAVHLAACGHGIVADHVRTRAADSPRLGERELKVLRLVACGVSNTQIARRLHVSPTTVKRTVTALLRAFGCTTRIELTAAAWETGYLPGR